MRILKRGKIPEPLNPYKVTCPNCNTEFEYEDKDMKQKIEKHIESFMTLGGVWDEYIKTQYYCVHCPLCNYEYKISNTEVVSKDILSFDDIFKAKQKEFEAKIGWND